MEVANKGCLSVPQEKCLRCSHMVLFDFKGRKEEDCTAENGNDQCPAQGVMVVLGVNVAKAAASIVRAFKANDAADIAAKMHKLSGYHETVQQQVMDEVRLGLAPVAPSAVGAEKLDEAPAPATTGTSGTSLPEVQVQSPAAKNTKGAEGGDKKTAAANPESLDKLARKYQKPKT